MTFPILITIAIAAITSLALTPVVRRLAVVNGFVDRPDGGRKQQLQATALGGGLVVLLALLVGLAAAWPAISADLLPELLESADLLSLAGLAAASLLICGVGFADDLWEIRGTYKLLWQMAAASLVIGSGLFIDKMALFGVTLQLGPIGLLLTMAWLLVAINSLNLIDGVDGLAATVGVIFSFAIGTMALMTGHPLDAMIAFALAGALSGLLWFNLPPAKIYLGDAGSMMIGLILGTLAVRSSVKEAATIAYAAPLAIWAIPLFDSFAAVLRRTLTGRSIYATDRGHIHHRLLTRGLPPAAAVALVAGLCAVTAAAAVASVYFRSEWLGAMIAAIVLIGLVAGRVFGHVELLLLQNHLLGFGKSWSVDSRDAAGRREADTNLQGSPDWDELWTEFVAAAAAVGLFDVRLSLHLPQRHEEFYARWTNETPPPRTHRWHLDFPVQLDGEVIGRLKLRGAAGNDDTSGLSDANELVETFQLRLRTMLEDGAGEPPAAGRETLTVEPAGKRMQSLSR